MSKKSQLLSLSKLRQRTRWKGYRGIGSYYRGAFECNHVSPYFKSACNVDAEIFVLLQDWSSHEGLSGGVDQEVVRLGHTPSLATNRNLVRLLDDVFGVELKETFATNLFPFIKPGAMNSRIPTRDLQRAAREFAIPQIEIIQPKLVVCLGLVTFQAIQREVELVTSKTIDQAISAPFALGSSRVWCQAHTGGLGMANRNRGGVDRVTKDWLKMKRSLKI